VKVATDKQLARYLDEHYFYELQMLRYARQRLVLIERPEWNLTYEAYSIHARTLRDFYTNREPKDRNASEYGVFDLKGSKRIDAIIKRVNKQVAHLDNKRPYGTQPRKLRRKGIDEIADWIERKHRQFMSRCRSSAKSGWQEPVVEVVSTDHAAAASSAYSQSISFTGPTGPASPIQTIVTVRSE